MQELIPFDEKNQVEFMFQNNINDIGYSDFINAIGKKTLFNYTITAIQDSEFIKFDGKKIRFKKKVNPSQFAGFFFESFFATYIEGDYFLKNKLFTWSSRITKDNYWEDYGYESLEQFMRCLSVVSKGSLKAKVFHTNDYCNACKNDIVFIIKDRCNGLEDRTICGIQIKAINTNEKSEIVKKILDKKYKNVITLLQDNTGYHSQQRCYDVVCKMIEKRKITPEEGRFVMSRIASPYNMGIPQEFINRLYRFIVSVAANGFKVNQPLDMNFYLLLKSFEKIALAESGNKVIAASVS